MFDVIFNLYNQVKYCGKIGIGSQISFLGCCVGVTWGENFAPLLFYVFLNGMSECISHAHEGQDVREDCTSQILSDGDIEVYLKLYLLLYEDVTIIMAESECELQAALNPAHHYCTLSKLAINIQKTKVMIFF